MRKAIIASLCSITALKSNGCNLSTVMGFVTQQPCGCLRYVHKLVTHCQ